MNDETDQKFQKRNPKPSGWVGGRGVLFWTKSTQYGMQYKCPYCMKVTRGLGGDRKDMHREGCPNVEANPWVAWGNHSKSKKR